MKESNQKPVSKKNAPPPVALPPDDGKVALVVWNVPRCNFRLLICHRPEDDGRDPTKLVSVDVRTNVYFLPKMRLRARPVSRGHFALEGPTPVRRGVWGR